MNKQEAELIVYAIDSGLKVGGTNSEQGKVADAFRNLRTILFDCFKSEYKPGVAIFLEYLKSSGSPSAQLIAAVSELGKYRKLEIIKSAQMLLSVVAPGNPN